MLQLVLLRIIISIEMPLHTAIVCDLQYLSAIFAIFELTRASVLKLGEVRSLLIRKLILKLKEKGLRLDLVLKMKIDPMK